MTFKLKTECSCLSKDCKKCICKDNLYCNSKCHKGKNNPNCTKKRKHDDDDDENEED